MLSFETARFLLAAIGAQEGPHRLAGAIFKFCVTWGLAEKPAHLQVCLYQRDELPRREVEVIDFERRQVGEPRKECRKRPIRLARPCSRQNWKRCG